MLADNLKQVQEQIASALDKRKNKNLLTGDKVTLVAVTKNHPPEIITDIEALGIANVGENRVQELLEKYDQIDWSKGVTGHMIGRLQTNKVKYIVDKVACIQSVDSIKLAGEIGYTCLLYTSDAADEL